MKKLIAIFTIALLAGFQVVQAQDEEEPKTEHLTVETFKEKVYDYEANPDEWVYEGDKPCIVDFYADWCAACKELESITFMDKAVMEEGKRFVLLRFDATKMTPEFDLLMEKFKILGLPTIVFHDGQTWRTDLTLTGFESGPEFLLRMKKVK